MFKKLLLICTLMLALPALATAGTWYVSASASPSTAGTVTPAGFTSYTDSTATATYSVAATAPGYGISSVRVGGVIVPPNADGTYTVSKKIATQYLVAYFTTISVPCKVTPSITAGLGSITAGFTSPLPSALVAGQTYTFKVTPSPGYAISSITQDGNPVTVTAPAGQSVTFTAIAAGDHTLKASFAFQPQVSAGVSAAGSMAVGAPVYLTGVATTNDTGISSYVYKVNGSTAGVTVASDGKSATFTPATAGQYLVDLRATSTSGGVGDAKQITVTILSANEASTKGCTTCHSSRNAGLVTNYTVSAHNAGAVISCDSCHNTAAGHPGGVNASTVSAVTFKTLTSNVNGLAAKATNYCSTCHSSIVTEYAATGHGTNGHGPTCAKCHTAGGAGDAHAIQAKAMAFNACGVGGICHNAPSPYAAPKHFSNISASYVSKPGATKCAGCHFNFDPHNVGAAQVPSFLTNTQVMQTWAEGGHADTNAGAWKISSSHAWDTNGAVNGDEQNAGARGCVRCHNGAGFMAWIGANGGTPFTSNPAIAAVSDQKNGTVLGCYGCHVSYTGELRTPGAVTVYYNYSSKTTGFKGTVRNVAHTYPDVKSSNVCVSCHSGRQSGETYTALAAKFGNMSGSGFAIGPHDAPAALTLFANAYNATPFTPTMVAGHDKIGVDNTNGTGTSGPCAACHGMSGTNHSFEAKADNPLCVKCHISMDDATIAAAKAKLDTATAVIAQVMKNAGYAVVLNSSGAFDRNSFPASVAVRFNNAKLGSTMNTQLLSLDAGSYVHNPAYVRKMIADAIDAFDDGVMNGSTNTTVNNLTSVTGIATWDAAAKVEFLDGITTASAACSACHAAKVETVQSGKHAAETSSHTGACGRCHTTEGYVAYSALVAAGTKTYDSSNGGTFTYTGNQNVSCAACHDTHGHVRTTTNWDPKVDVAGSASDQFKLCTSCHNLVNASGVPVASGLTVSGQTTVPKQQHQKDWYRNIATTHYDLTTTGVGQASTVVEGYNVRWNKDSACTDCHGHEFYTDTEGSVPPAGATTGTSTVHTEWAQSGHAGKLLKAKFAAYTTAGPNKRIRNTASNAAVMAAGVTGTSGAAWEHYDWDNSSGDSGDRKTCQKCHTATGSSNYLTNPATYNPANNDFSHLVGWTANKKSNQNEVLYCWGCHNDAATGALRNPGAITTADYKFHGANASYPDVGASNVCITCHGGQASGETITALTAAGNNFTNVSFVNSHYMAAAGLMYVKIGYTNFVAPQTQVAGTTGSGIVSYGQTLTNDADQTVDVNNAAVAGKLTSTHRKIGTAAMATDSHFSVSNPAPASFLSGGPCAGCHYASGDHSLEMGQKQLDAVCSHCHGSEAPDVAGLQNFLEENSASFQSALTLALKLLEDNYHITYNQAVYPYFYDKDAANGAVKNWTRSASSLAGGALSAADAEKLMGACFNINLLKRDPAAYAHARTYARRLLYDTIDFLDNKTIDQSVGASALASGLKDGSGNDLFGKGAKAYTDSTLSTKDAGTTDGMVYILGWSRTTGAWNAYERP